MSWPQQLAEDCPIDPGLRPDPYACWAAATQGRFLASHTVDRCRLALRLRQKHKIKELRQLPGVTIPGVYQDPMRFCTAEVLMSDPGAWLELHRLADVLLAEPGLARPGDKPIELHRLTEQGGVPTPSPRVRSSVVVAVIDGACGFANRQFRHQTDGVGPWKTRLVGFWDQHGSVGAATDAWTLPPDLGYGRELQLDRLDKLFEEHLPDAPNDGAEAAGERAIYRELAVALPEAADWSHGTHVFDTAGGSPPRRYLPPPAPGVDDLLVPTAEVAAAELIAVQLPEVALRDTSGRWAAALVLDGLRYIVQRAGNTAQIVVNLSLGSFAGPHDGSSMLEQAIDALIGELKLKDRLTVVVAAGNAGEPRNDGDGTVRPCHAEARLAAAGEVDDQATLAIDIDEADDTETFIELWLPNEPLEHDDFAAVTVALVPPGGSAPLSAGSRSVATWIDDADSGARAQVVNLSRLGGLHARGDGPMVLLSIGATRGPQACRAPLGRWLIRVRNEWPAPIVLQAWIERRDVPGELTGERPQYGFASLYGVELTSANTLGSMANGEKTTVVAAAEFVGDKMTRMAPSSSSAPRSNDGEPGARRPKGPGPRVAAVCEFTAAGFLTGSYKTLKGTSMSSAWVARLIAADLLARGRPATGDAIDQLFKPAYPRKSRGPTKTDLIVALLRT